MAIKDLENNKAQNAFKKVFYNASDAILIISGDKFIDCNAAYIQKGVRTLKEECRIPTVSINGSKGKK